MKKIFLICLLSVFGCATATIPLYLPNKKPYVKRFYATYDDTLAAVNETLKDLGWTVEKTTDPTVYEQPREEVYEGGQMLLLTAIRETRLVVGTRYARMNIYLRSQKTLSEVEIRYLTVNSMTFRSFKDYTNDSEVKRIFGHLEEILNRVQSTQSP